MCCCRKGSTRFGTSDACIRLIRRSSQQSDGADEIFDRLICHFHQFPVTEKELGRLSLLQQHFENTHGMEEYACTTVYLCAQYSKMNQKDTRVSTVRSIRSFNELAMGYLPSSD